MATATIRSGVIWEGLQESTETLRRLPERFREHAGRIVEESARTLLLFAQAHVPTHDHTGNLRRAWVIRREGPLRWVVANAAPHSHLYEWGYDHVDGKRVEGHDVLIPEAVELRARMHSTLDRLFVTLATDGGYLEAA